MDYLIRIYSAENSIILDPFCGSGSTGVAAVNVKREFVGIDMDDHYCQIARDRVESACPETPLASPTSVLNHLS